MTFTLERGEDKRFNTLYIMKTNVMIIERNIIHRALVRTILERDTQGRFKVTASSHNITDAIEKLERMKNDIDVIIMDVDTERGLESIKQIVHEYAKPILLFSSLTYNGSKEAIQGLSNGAVDYLTKPASGNLKEVEDILIQKIAYITKVKSSVRKEEHLSLSFPSPKLYKPTTSQSLKNVILIASSTGGPRSLTKLMSELSPQLEACIVIVQHMQTGGFTQSFANSLNQISPFQVKEAEEGDLLEHGKAFVAPAGFQTEVFKRQGKYQLSISQQHMEHRLKPSADVLFSSVARLTPSFYTFGVVLTGMGHDGTNGCKALKRINNTIIAESERTAVLYGMPKQVAKQGLTDYIEDLDKIVPRIETVIKSF